MKKRVLGRTGFEISAIGFGGYRIDDHDPDVEIYEQSLRDALASGCNLIDTSTNYGNGGSERLIGTVLKQLFAAGPLKRSDVFVVSKAGYVQGENMKLARARVKAGTPFPDMVEYSSECWHCISPEFLREQLDLSLARLELTKLDVLLLHNPEYFLNSGGEHSEYYARIRRAFEYLETEVERGRISYYGISSNTFGTDASEKDFTSLEEVIKIAESIRSDHHFAVIQFPLNLLEPGAVTTANNSGKSVTDLAREKKIGTLVNRPLNAFRPVGGVKQLLRLADFPFHEHIDVTTVLRSALDTALELEVHFPDKDIVPTGRVAWAHVIRENFSTMKDLDQWKQILRWQIQPTLQTAMAHLEKTKSANWGADYLRAMEKLFRSFTQYLEAEAAIESRSFSSMLHRVSEELRSSPTLSQKALRTYLSCPGIDCVLVGMRTPKYVRDAMNVLKSEPIAADQAKTAFAEAKHV